jgi:site-specific DNA recombinase
MNSVLYARVSSKEQSEGYSIDAQIDLIRDYAARQNIRILKEFHEIESAKVAGRPLFNQMLEFVHSKKIEAILVEKTDRIYRNFKDLVNVEEASIEVHLVKENEIISESSSSHKNLIHGIKVVMAKFFIDNLKEETKKGMRKKASQGGIPFLAPVGYLNKDGSVFVDDERADLVKKAFQLYSEGNYSLVSLKEELTRLGLRTKKGTVITKHGLERTLKNPFYYGSFKWSGEIWKGTHEPLISKELFDSVQAKLSNKYKSKPQSRWFAFRGILKCGYCGCSITPERIKNKYVYYTCTRGKRPCKQDYVKEQDIDKLFSEALGKFRIDESVSKWITQALKESHQDEEKAIEIDLKRLQAEYTRNETSIHRIYDDRLNNVIDESFFKLKFKEMTERQSQISIQLAHLRSRNLSYIEEGAKFLELVKDIKNQYDAADMEQKSKILKALVLNCEIKGLTATFRWNKPFDILYDMGQKEKWGG